MNRICRKCNIEKPLIEFGKAKQYKDGYETRCKVCCNIDKREKYLKYKIKPSYKATRAEYRRTHKEQEKKLSREWYRNNKKRHRTAVINWVTKNKEHLRKKVREYCERTKNIRREYNIKHKKENPALYKSYKAMRRARELQAMPVWADKNKIMGIYKQCCKISEETGILHHVDHIIPLHNKLVCGLHVEFNLQVIPAVDNLRKSNRLES